MMLACSRCGSGVGHGRLTGRDTLDTATTSQTADGGFSDTLDVVAQDLTVTLGATLSKTLASLAACESMLVVCDSKVCYMYVYEGRRDRLGLYVCGVGTRRVVVDAR